MRAKENKPKLNLMLKFLVFLNIINSIALIFAYCSTFISPNFFIYFSYFGLSYPIWLFIALAFMLLWLLIGRWRIMLVSLLAILLGFNHLTHFFAFNFSNQSYQNEIKIMSYNVRIFNLYDLENRHKNRDEIFAFLKQEDAGIYCFQEYYHQDGNTDFVTKETMIPLLETIYYHERYTHELSNQRYFGVATFSKYPIVYKGEIPFENDKNNYCIYSDIKINQDTIRVFNAHIGSIRFQEDDYRFFDENALEDHYINSGAGQQILRRLKIAFEKRAIQAETIIEKIKNSPYPVVLCGDLNDTPVSYCYGQFDAILNDAFVASGNGIGTTYIGEIPSNRIDYIFYSEELKSRNFKTHDVSYSDHKPISSFIGF